MKRLTAASIIFLFAFLNIAHSLEVQQLENSDFSATTLGSEEISGGDFNTPAAWNLGARWAIAGGKATYTFGVGSSDMYQAAVCTAGRYYVLTYTVVANGGFDGSLSMFTTGGAVDSLSAVTGTYTHRFIAAGPRLYFRGIDGTVGTLDLDDVSVREETLNNYTIIGTRDSTSYLEYESGITITSDGDNIGIKQSIPNGMYRYNVVMDSNPTGSLMISPDGTPKITLSVGTNTGYIDITTGEIQLRRKTLGDPTVGTVSLFEMYLITRPAMSMELGLTPQNFLEE